MCVCMGGGGPGQSDKKAQRVFCVFIFSPPLIFSQVNWLASKKTHFSRLQRGSNIFQGGGIQLLISYRNPYNL